MSHNQDVLQVFENRFYRMIPEWANNVFINKGLGFESHDFKAFVYGYFDEQFQGMNLPISDLQNYLEAFLDSETKKGTIDKAISHFKQHCLE